MADPTRAQAVLGFRPRYTSLDRIVETAWAWHAAHPGGFQG